MIKFELFSIWTKFMHAHITSNSGVNICFSFIELPCLTAHRKDNREIQPLQGEGQVSRNPPLLNTSQRKQVPKHQGAVIRTLTS
jgi:hypothetical protein